MLYQALEFMLLQYRKYIFIRNINIKLLYSFLINFASMLYCWVLLILKLYRMNF